MTRRAILFTRNGISSALELGALTWLRSAGRRQYDAFLCSYPKSGRTWLRFMISAYQVRLFLPDFHLTMRNFALISPNLLFNTRMGLRTKMLNERIRRVYGTHLPYNGLFRSARGIFLERDLRDVLMSYYHHRRARGEINEGLDDYVTSDEGLGRAIRYLKPWYAALTKLPSENWCRLRYEEMLADPEQNLRRCITFLQLPLDDHAVSAAVAAASADNMRLLEEKQGTYDFTPQQIKANPTVRHVRKARAGTYHEELGVDAAARVEAAVRHLRSGD